MYGIIAITGVVNEDYQGEIRLLMHNTTESDYKVLKENPTAQMVVYHTDKLSTIYHTGDCMPSQIKLQVMRGDRDFGEVTNLFQVQLTDDLSDIEVLCSGADAHELWQTPNQSSCDPRTLPKVYCVCCHRSFRCNPIGTTEEEA